MSVQQTKMLGARIPVDAINKIKVVARALGTSDADALARIIHSYAPTPAMERAIAALKAADEAMELAAAEFTGAPKKKRSPKPR